jgi:triosephosphate isomerase
MKNLIVANWKCNPINLREAKKLFNQINKKAKAKNTEVVICPPFVYLGLLEGKNLGAQNVCFEEKGAFTGEVSALMLKDVGVSYVIVGHSERRKYFNETNLQINGKIKNSLEVGLKPILCIGETKQEFEMHLKPEVLETQITEALRDITKEQVKKIVIAYEPVWAISTSGSESCSIDEAMTSIVFIRKIISEKYNREIADNMQIIYGGSVTSFNSSEYIKNTKANGLLVGGASLNAEEFIKIVKSAK